MDCRRVLSWGGLGIAAAAVALLLAGERVLEIASRMDSTFRGRAYRSRCEYREATGRACLGCGGTRALRLAREGRLVESARANALGFAVAAGLVALAVGAAAASTLRRPGVLLATLAVAGSLVAVGLVVQIVRRWPGGFS